MSVFSNSSANTLLSGSSGKDSISNSSRYATIMAGAGNDTIYNNDGDYSFIDGGAGNDSVHAYDNDAVTVNANAGNDSVTGAFYSSKIFGDEGADYISISGSTFTNTVDGGNGDDTITANGGSLFGGAGNDKITVSDNSYSKSTINGGAGNDTLSGGTSTVYGDVFQFGNSDGYDVITNYGENDTIHLTDANSINSSYKNGSDYIITTAGGRITLKGAANTPILVKFADGSSDTINQAVNIINNTISNTLLSGVSYADSVYNSGRYVSIQANNGNDTIYNYNGDYSKISGGAGNDSIHAYDNDVVTVDAGAGNDTVTGSYYSSKISLGDGTDYISISGGGNTIDGGADNDTIFSYYGSISGGAGNDKISVTSNYYSTINGGTGNDTIYGYSSSYYGIVYQYALSDGNDTIYNFGVNDTIHITLGNYTTQKSGNDFILNIGSGSIVLKNAADTRICVKNNSGNIQYYNGSNTISGTSGNDTLKNEIANKMQIYGYAGNDSIYNSGRYASIIGGDGNDTIYNYNGDYSTISGGAGNDSIRAYDNDAVTVDAGVGNDTVTGNYYSSKISLGDGTDYISISGGTTNTIDGGADNDTIFSYYGGSINGGAGNDKISVTSAYYYSTINGGAGNDTLSGGNSTVYGSVYQFGNNDGYDVITNYGVTDTIYLTEADSVEDYDKVGNDCVINTTNGKITLQGAGNKNITVKLADGSFETINLNINYIDNYTANTLVSGGKGKDYISNYALYATVNAGNGNDTIIDNIGGTFDYASINGGAGNDFVSVGSNLGYHTIVGGKGNDTVTGSVDGINEVFQFGNSDGNDLILNYGVTDTIHLTETNTVGSNYVSGSDYIINTSSGKITLQGAADIPIIVKLANGSVTTLNNQINYINNYNNDTLISGTSKKDSIYNSGLNVVINSGNGNDSITNRGYNVQMDLGDGNDFVLTDVSPSYGRDNYKDATVYGGKGNDTIVVNDNKTSLNGGEDNDFISVTGGKFGSWLDNTLVGGLGDDTIHVGNTNLIQYAKGDGNDVVFGFDSKDTLEITSGNYSTLESGNDIHVIVESGYIILKDAKGKKLNIVVDEVGSNTSLPAGLSFTEMTVTEEFTGKTIDLTQYASVKKLTATDFEGSLSITGNDLDNTILSSSASSTIDGGDGDDYILGDIGNDSLVGGDGDDYILGDAGADTLQGGNGDDTLVGGKGKDLFVYNSGDGSCLIDDYTAGQDKIKITGSISATKVVGKNVVFTIGDGTLTVKNGKGKKITVNGSTKTYKKSVSELFADDDFVKSDDISNIVENKVVAEFENTTEKVTQEKLITFAK